MAGSEEGDTDPAGWERATLTSKVLVMVAGVAMNVVVAFLLMFVLSDHLPSVPASFSRTCRRALQPPLLDCYQVIASWALRERRLTALIHRCRVFQGGRVKPCA